MTERGPIVYVVQEPRFKDPKHPGEYKAPNMIDLARFGSEELLLDNSRQVSLLNAASITRTLKQKLQYFRDCDFLVASGDPGAIGIACSIVALANRGRYTLLKWDRQESKYYPVPINILEMT